MQLKVIFRNELKQHYHGENNSSYGMILESYLSWQGCESNEFSQISMH
jgi:hypothetical protein